MIIYFSGTGNSYSLAKKLGERLNEKVVPLKKAANDGSSNLIFVFPLYCGDIPPNVRAFLKSLEIRNDQIVMGICTSGGGTGNAEYSFNRIMKNKGIRVLKFLLVNMTDNSYPVIFGSDLERISIDEDEVINNFLEMTYTDTSSYNPLNKINELLFFNSLSKQLLKKKLVKDKCVGCGLCKAICPNKNIEIVVGKAEFGKNCAECFGCVHACPYQAIYVRRDIEKNQQYTNSNISIKDLNQ